MSLSNAHHFQQKNLFGGTGTVDIWNLMARQAPPFAAVLWCELEPNGRVGHHRQTDHPEILIGLSGMGIVEVNRTAIDAPFTEGSFVYLPLGAVLAIENTGTESLKYLIIKAKEPQPTV